MAERRKSYCVEISDIFDAEQEDFIIEKVRGFLRQSEEELREYFKTTDTIKVKKLSEEEAKKLVEEVKAVDVSVQVYDVDERRRETEAGAVRCPKCGYVLAFPDWRCPECYYEFPDYGEEGG